MSERRTADLDFSLAFPVIAKTVATRVTTIVITTSNSTRVKPGRRRATLFVDVGFSFIVFGFHNYVWWQTGGQQLGKTAHPSVMFGAAFPKGTASSFPWGLVLTGRIKMTARNLLLAGGS
jgi:hypothetical protein